MTVSGSSSSAWSLSARTPGQSAVEMVAALRARGAADREVRSWELGAEGERIAARVFAGLPSGWTVLHDVPVGGLGANIDHVLIGPAGVFTVNTKHHRGADVAVAGQQVLVRGEAKDYVEKSLWEGQRASSLLSDCTGRFVAVQPILLFVAPGGVSAEVFPRGVFVTTDRDVLGLLASFSPELSSRRVAEIVAAAEQPETWLYAVRRVPDVSFDRASGSRGWGGGGGSVADDAWFVGSGKGRRGSLTGLGCAAVFLVMLAVAVWLGVMSALLAPGSPVSP